ncbi:putative metallopeptidase [Paradevosia shaoguanensis]|uniref:putative metallopeptidase n=1 Tax=Paradevosia shaoguanensis TaxID=1335043 RepID=UPI001FECD48F|nr:putative metallopeptidase [Paradevosia shaoguanensis]
MKRPMPPDGIFDNPAEPVFYPARDLVDWSRETFINEGAVLLNEDHRHLRWASIGALWTNVPNGRAGRRVVGQCEMGVPPMGKWGRARMERQLLDWFGEVPTFLLTFDAEYTATCTDAEFMALVEHELYHAGQERDAFGAPRFNKQTGKPIYGIRGHDVEEFVGVVRRYGDSAAHVEEMVAAANAGPEIARVDVTRACGTCQLRAA